MKDKRRAWVAAIVIVFAGLVAYHNSFGGPFIFDDLKSIPDNPSIRSLRPIGPVLESVGDGRTVQGRPLLNLSFAVNHALGGTNVVGYHVMNLAIHVLAALALFGVVRRTLLLPKLREGFGGASTGLALAAALLWLVHPLQTESVTYIVQRAESLVGLWYLLTLYGCVRALDTRRRSIWYAVAIGACLLGMASKEVMVSAPLMVVLYDRVFVWPSFGQALRERRGLYGTLAATVALLATLVLQAEGRGGTVGAGDGIGSWNYALTQIGAVTHYLRLCFWPDPLVLNHGTAVVGQLSEVLPQAILIGLLLAGVVVAFRHRPWIGFLGTWFFAILAPTSSVIPVLTQTVAEHRMYLPLAAVVVLVVLLAHAVWRRLELRASPAILLALVVAALTWRTVQRNDDYRTDLSIWSKTVQQAPDVPVSRLNLGGALMDAGQVREAMLHFREALRLEPGYGDAYVALGSAQVVAGEIPQAIENYREALRLEPDYPEVYYNLGNALAASGRIPQAIEHFDKALELKPDYPEARNNLGLALATVGRIPEAIEAYREALRLVPGSPETHNNLGNALVRARRIPEAIEAYREALRLDPDLLEAHYNLGSILLDAGRLPEAIDELREALRLEPDFPEARKKLDAATRD